MNMLNKKYFRRLSTQILHNFGTFFSNSLTKIQRVRHSAIQKVPHSAISTHSLYNFKTIPTKIQHIFQQFPGIKSTLQKFSTILAYFSTSQKRRISPLSAHFLYRFGTFLTKPLQHTTYINSTLQKYSTILTWFQHGKQNFSAFTTFLTQNFTCIFVAHFWLLRSQYVRFFIFCNFVESLANQKSALLFLMITHTFKKQNNWKAPPFHFM